MVVLEDPRLAFVLCDCDSHGYPSFSFVLRSVSFFALSRSNSICTVSYAIGLLSVHSFFSERLHRSFSGLRWKCSYPSPHWASKRTPPLLALFFSRLHEKKGEPRLSR